MWYPPYRVVEMGPSPRLIYHGFETPSMECPSMGVDVLTYLFRSRRPLWELILQIGNVSYACVVRAPHASRGHVQFLLDH